MNRILEVLYHDQWIVAVNKPNGLLVHKSQIALNVSEFALQILRNQLNQKVYPVHRLDRKTSGVLLFTFNESVLKKMQAIFAERKVHKEYYAIVRGFTDDTGTINYPLKKDNGQLQEAVTEYTTVERTEIPVSLGKFNTQRYSLVRAIPLTGRMHQIRKHFAHISHPIIADRPHGCNKQNRFFKENWEIDTLLLHARSLQFTHPETNAALNIQAPFRAEFKKAAKILGIDLETL